MSLKIISPTTLILLIFDLCVVRLWSPDSWTAMAPDVMEVVRTAEAKTEPQLWITNARDHRHVRQNRNRTTTNSFHSVGQLR
jgi:hypothetical protein